MMFEEYENHDVAVYGGYIIPSEKILQSSSGGIATALAEKTIENGGYVAGVSYSDDFRFAEYVILKDQCELAALKGSKYIETKKNKIYADVKSLLNQGSKVLFIGLPCEVAALYRYIGSRHENLLTCELVCYGPMSQKVHEEYITFLENKYHSKLTDFSVRHKKQKWTPNYLYAKFANGKIFKKPFSETEYGMAFPIFGREVCYNCRFKGNNRCGDIMVGDFWGASKKDAYWNEYGVSVIFAETQKGNDFLLSMKNIKLVKTSFTQAVKLNRIVIESKQKSQYYDKFSKLFEEKGLRYAASHAMSTRRRILNMIKKVTPKPLFLLTKKLYCSISHKV